MSNDVVEALLFTLEEGEDSSSIDFRMFLVDKKDLIFRLEEGEAVSDSEVGTSSLLFKDDGEELIPTSDF